MSPARDCHLVSLQGQVWERIQRKPPAVLSCTLFAGFSFPKNVSWHFLFVFFLLAFSWYLLFGSFWQYSLFIISFLTTLFVLVLVVILNKFICHSRPNAYFCIAIEEWWQQRLKSSNRPCLAVHQCWKQHHSCLGALWTLAFQRLIQGSHPSRKGFTWISRDRVL